MSVTDEQIEKQAVSEHVGYLYGFEAGWEARGKEDEQVCRDGIDQKASREYVEARHLARRISALKPASGEAL
jgi:hypothetical protein